MCVCVCVCVCVQCVCSVCRVCGRVWGGGSDPKSAASDPLFVTKLKEGFLDCYNVAQAWPQAALDRNPLYQKYGRHMIFFNCATKVEEQMCTKYQARQWLEQLYGRLDEELLGVLGREIGVVCRPPLCNCFTASVNLFFFSTCFWKIASLIKHFIIKLEIFTAANPFRLIFKHCCCSSALKLKGKNDRYYNIRI